MSGAAKLAVASLSADVAHERAVASDLDVLATVRHCKTNNELLDLILARQVNAIVVDLLDQSGSSVAPLIAEAHAEYPGMRMVVDLPATPEAFEQVPAALWAGASEVSIRGYDRLRDTVETVLEPDWQPGAGLALLETVPPMVPESLKAFAIACALKGSPRLTVDRVADWVGTSPRTIRSRLRRAELSSPLAFVRYCSAAQATCLLFPQRLSPDRVVERMRFGTRRALHDLVEHYSGGSTELVPDHWAYAALLLRAERFLQRQATPQPVHGAFAGEGGRLDRRAQGDVVSEVRRELEQLESDVGIPAADVLRVLGASEHETQQLKEETWVRLVRSIGPELGA